jgi:hypothetical protein
LVDRENLEWRLVEVAVDKYSDTILSNHGCVREPLMEEIDISESLRGDEEGRVREGVECPHDGLSVGMGASHFIKFLRGNLKRIL